MDMRNRFFYIGSVSVQFFEKLWYSLEWVWFIKTRFSLDIVVIYYMFNSLVVNLYYSDSGQHDFDFKSLTTTTNK